MKLILSILAFLALLIPVAASAQVAISASAVEDSFGRRVSTGKLCFDPVNAAEQETGFRTGSIQVVPGPVCGLVSAGILQTGLSLVPNVTATYYHITLTNRTTNAVMRDFGMTSIVGTNWSLDTYDPAISSVPATALEMGTTTTLAAGSSASCSLAGSNPTLLNCGIPQGIQGTAGTLANNSGYNGTVGSTTPNIGAFTQLNSQPASGLGTGFLTPLPFSAAVSNVVGMAQDTTGNCYAITSGALQAFNCATGVAGATNGTPFSGLPAGTNHLGGGEVCGPSMNYLCVPADIEVGSSLTSPVVAEYNLSNLTLATYFSISSGSCDGSALAYNVNTNDIVCASFYTAGNTADLWNFTSQTLVGTLTFSPALPGIQGFSYDNVHNQYCAFYDDSYMTIGYISSVSTAGVVTPYAYNGGVIPFTGELEGGTCAQGAVQFPAPTNGGLFAVVPSTGTLSTSGDGMVMQANMQTSSTTGNYSNPPGGASYGSSQVVANTSGAFLQSFPGQSGTYNLFNGYELGITTTGQVVMPGGFGVTNPTSYIYNCHYGVAYDGIYFYCSSPSGAIASYNATSPWAQVNINTSAWSQMGMATPIVRDLEYSAGNLYVAAWSSGSSCANYTGASIGVFTASTLAYSNVYSLSGGIKAPTGVGINAGGSVAYVADLCDSAEMYKYSLPSWTFISTVAYSTAISGARGISYNTTTGNLSLVNATSIYTLTTAGKILTVNNSPIKTGSPEGIDANYGTSGIFTQNSILYPITLSSCCGLQAYGVPLSSPISAGDLPISAGNGQFIDSTYGIPQLSANSWTSTQTFLSGVYFDPTTSSGGSNLASQTANFRVWPGACSTPAKLDTTFTASMGSGSGGALFTGFTAPSSASMASAGCTGQRYFSLSNYDVLNFQGILELYTSPFIYFDAFSLRLATPIALTNTTTLDVPNAVTGYIGFGLSTPLGTPTYATGTNITSVACASGYTCVNTGGEVKVVAGASATTGTIATITFSNPLMAAAIGGSGGSGYVTNDTVTFTCTTTNAVATVTAASGVVTALAVTTPGAGCSTSTNTAPASTSGSGTGLQANLTAGLSAAPNCHVDQNGGATLYGIGHGTPTSTAFTITAGVSVASATVYIDYTCGVN